MIEKMEIQPKITNVRSVKPYHALVTIEPLERGYGYTLGNALRRVMMSSIPGAAATEVKIEGVVHEYDRVEGMREDVVLLLLNLKNVVFQMRDTKHAVVTIKKSEAGTVTAGDIKVPHNVEILNKDHVLATLTKKGSLDMEITIEEGVGYETASARESEDEEKRFGVIYLDAFYSPVKRAAFQVENTRVGNRTDLDRLVLDIETSGAFDFEEIIRSAADILMEHLALFSSIDKVRALNMADSFADDGAVVETVDQSLFTDKVDKLDLTMRSRNCLRQINIRYIGELVQKTEKELMQTPHLGRKSLLEIKHALAAMNLELGMTIADWATPQQQ